MTNAGRPHPGSGPSLQASREVSAHLAQPARPDEVVDERAGPVPLPGEPAPQLRLGRHDRRTHARGDQVRQRAARVGAALAAVGPSSIEDLRTELRLKRQELKALRYPLERCGAIVSRSMEVTAGAGEQHAGVLARWDQAYPGGGDSGTDPGRALADLVVAGVRGAVVAPEAEPRRWFSWQWYWTGTLIDDLVRARRLRRVDGYLAADPE